MPVVRSFDGAAFNRLINSPDVKPFIATGDDDLDASALILNQNNILLVGDSDDGDCHGAVVFHYIQNGVYEAHTQVEKSRRGPWALEMVEDALLWMFTRTLAVEILTRVPEGNRAALALTKRVHGRYLFRNPRGWVQSGAIVPADVYSLTIQDWIATAPGLEESGAAFHDRLEAEFERLGRKEAQHEEDATHNRYVGAAYAMIAGGAVEKGVIFYNRWAALAGYHPISIFSYAPLTIDIGNAYVIVRSDGTFWVASLHKLAA